MFSLASLGTIIACVFLLGTFLSVALNVRSTMQQMEQSVGISVFFEPGISAERKDQIGEEIKKKEDIATMRYVSAEEAWESYKKDVFQGNEELLEGFEGNNPLKESDSYEITLKEVKSYQQVVSHLETIDGVRKVRYSEGAAEGMTKINTMGTYLAGGIILILMAVSIFLVSNTVSIGVAVREEEISIMKLIGAANGFIKAPFQAEGMIIGILGSLIPTAIIFAGYEGIINWMNDKFHVVTVFMKFVPIQQIMLYLLPLALLVGIVPMTTVFAAAKKQQVKQETKKLEEQSRKMQQEIKDLDEKMIKSNDAYEACQEKLISVQKQLKKTQQELKEAKASKEDQSRIMSKRIKFLYENGNMAYMEVIFEANNFQEFLKRADYVSKISKYDSNMFLQLQTTEDKIRMATKSLKQDYQNTKTLTAKAKTEKEKLDQAAAKKKSKLAFYQKQLASDKELLAWFEAEEKRQEEMDLASAKDGNADNTTSKAQSEKNMTGSTASKNTTSKATTESKKETTTTTSPATTVSSGNLSWPVPSCHSISSGYGYRIHPVTGVRKLHAGIDIPCSTGTTIVAAASGTVVDAGYNAYNGNYLKISHGNGLETMYLHCSKLLVSSGARVSGGQTIAKSGATGMVSGAHLHFVVKKNGNYVNPQNYL